MKVKKIEVVLYLQCLGMLQYNHWMLENNQLAVGYYATLIDHVFSGIVMNFDTNTM